MSLDVPTALLERAEAGQVDDEEFVDCVRRSLPYAWAVVSEVSARVHAGTADYADHAVPPPSETERGQLLRALASDAIRGGLERHFGVRLAFQNCHRVAAFRLGAVGGTTYQRFVSPLAQIRNQSPELRDC
ncbi:SCO5389 family protein [Micromonospora sp. WMMD1102]|uniref:SCO5389 family protein n=1 Tax=Micromonospora sp. WMMD1102 TaxID=3016105 RepID=UPI002414D6C0|nr:SCO5389 family protein [Micromonospora sp. WMMD1102]MDG4788927.1 SCO5389 family protein [Micromonospora sp. WMMD1102]